jgi:sterol desaturase/sphingolipid hydroxylase (fatty acid hydroxylase superfamily)
MYCQCDGSHRGAIILDVGANALLFAGGLLAWTFLEYVIHGWMSHTFRTFASPLHQVHHRDPRRVFTIHAWIPIATTWLAGLALWGFAPALIFYSGMVAGFATYEFMHYRIHFVSPRNRLEAYLRERHLVHHYRAPDRCFGVTSPLWDSVFRSGIADTEMRSMRAAVAAMPPLAGPSNVRMLIPSRAGH